jgi:hypothetical protein
MAGKVFVSCGQRDSERACAQEIGRILRDEFGLTPYLAFRTQSLADIMTITAELRSADYYLFVDFLRDPTSSTDFPCSLFTHQELALAHHLGFQDIIAFQQSGAPLEGFLRYVLSNPTKFSSYEELYSQLRDVVRERKWAGTYSRNLVVEPWDTWVGRYGDHTWPEGREMKVWSVKVCNRRPDVAAVRAVCILDRIENTIGQSEPSPDRSYLKWSGQNGYDSTIFPEDFGVVNILSVQRIERGAFLLSARDAFPRIPVLTAHGEYLLHFKIFSERVPMLRFAIPVSLGVFQREAWEMQIREFGPPIAS